MFLKERGVLHSRDEDFQAIGNLGSGGELLGVVGYGGFVGATCTMHVAGKGNWFSRDLLFASFDYPFNQIGMVQVFTCISANNRKALKFVLHVGFNKLSVIKGGWGLEVDMHILTMRREDCRWLAAKYKRKVA